MILCRICILNIENMNLIVKIASLNIRIPTNLVELMLQE